MKQRHQHLVKRHIAGFGLGCNFARRVTSANREFLT